MRTERRKDSGGTRETPTPFRVLGNLACLDLVNTEAISEGAPVNLLGGFGDLLAWLEAASLLTDQERRRAAERWEGTSAGRAIFREAIALRGALRTSAERLTAGKSAPADAVAAINRVLASRPAYRQRALVQRKVAEAIAKVRPFVQVEVVERPQGFDVRWRLDQHRLREAALFDGIYCLLTNWPLAEADLRTVFHAYKGQIQVEQRFRVTKHPPLQIRPVWLHQPTRIASLLFVVMVALFLFALIEREARRVVQATSQVFTGLRAEGRDHLPVTTRVLLDVFAPLSLIQQRLRVGIAVVTVTTPTTLTAIQAQILDRLNLMRPDAYLQPTITPHPT